MKQKEALEILKMGKNVFLTGSAGSGKTYLLNQYISYLKNNKIGVAVTASTGIAATHMHGITIHSWSGLGIKDTLSDKEVNQLSEKSYLARRFAKTHVLIIDEVSMIHAHFLDMVDKVCRKLKGEEKAFGGMQVILCGDFFQLPPVTRGSRELRYIDRSEAWNAMDLHVCYLQEQYRHEDDVLMKILQDIRKNATGEHTLVPLRTRYKGRIEGDCVPTKLYTHNVDVDRINNAELKNLEGEERVYEMYSHGAEKLVEALKRSCLAPENLVLKIGAVVMFVKNDPERRYVNGTLGKVIGFQDDGLPIVETYTGRRIVAELENWPIEENEKVKAEVEQLPLRLAWAITVHKSQGMTLDAAEIDLSKAFEKGMGYVALSRVRSLKGLRLMGLNKIALQIHEQVLDLDTSLREASEKASQQLKKMSEKERAKIQEKFADIKREKKKESTYEKTKKLLEKKLSIQKIAKERGMTEGTIISHIEKMLAKGEPLNISYLRKDIDPKRLKEIRAAFKKSGGTTLSPVRETLGENYSYEELRLARLFLRHV